jgi:REP element-mobilizing transposase RayT
MQQGRKNLRKPGFDYSSDGLYFVTSCVKGRICCFGQVIDKVMYRNEYGDIVQQQWEWLFEHYPYIKSHAFIVMPNHIHGVLEINRKLILERNVRQDSSIPDTPPMKIKPLSELMGAFKTTASDLIHEAGYTDFCWQRSFHDHIIRDERAYYHIVNYIKTNPEKWKEDTFFEEGF